MVCTPKIDGGGKADFAEQSAEQTNKRRNIAVSEVKRGKLTQYMIGGVSMGKGITYSTSGRDCPCCGCQERAVGCHGTCERYKAWNGKRQAERQERIRRTSILHEADKRKSAAVSHYKRRGRQA